MNQFTSGAVLLASSDTTDATLLRLNNSPDPAFNVTFAGWDNSPTAHQVSPGVCIHHPNGDEKRISFEKYEMTSTLYLEKGVSDKADHKKVTNWEIGTTEPGSSGAPLFNGSTGSLDSDTEDRHLVVTISLTGMDASRHPSAY